MNKLAKGKMLKEEIEQMRYRLYELLDADMPNNRIVSFSQELDLLINKYNELIKNIEEGI